MVAEAASGAYLGDPMGFPMIWLILAMAPSAQFPGMAVVEPPQTSDARIELSFDKPEYQLGEPILLHYCVTNVSKRPFDVEFGGDYRGGSRSHRFKVSVSNALGVTLPDPDRSGYHEGGASTTRHVAPGGRECRSLLLMRYARIDEPGRYSIRATHDLGWKTIKPPEGQATVTLSMPRADDVDRIIAATVALPDLEDYGGQRIITPRRDFSVLRYPIYLAPLVRLAEAGNVEALVGIGSIAAPEATRALVGLMQQQNRDVARDASRELAGRLPDPALEGRLPRRGPFNNEREEPRRYMRDTAWRPEFATPVRRVAAEWLASDDPALVIQAAFIIEAVGATDDAEALSGALDRALERTLTLPFEQGGYPRPRGAMRELMRAADVMVTLGYVPPAAPSTPGNAALWLTAFGKGARPEKWQATMAALLNHRIPYVAELALEKLPPSPPPELLVAIGPALTHADADLQIAALQAVTRLKLAGFAPQAAALCRSATDTMMLNFACNALHTTAGSAAVHDIMAARLTEPGIFSEALSSLAYGALEIAGMGIDANLSAEELMATSERWKVFLQAHRAELGSGKRFSVDDPAVAGLIPRGSSVRPIKK